MARIGADLEIGGDGFEIEVKKVDGRMNTRQIKAAVRVGARLETVWAVLTNYEALADFIPGLVVSRLLHYQNNFARLYQVGQQELALGFKFSAKGVIECYEKEMELVSASCRKRAIEFKMVDGDFKTFQGQWSVQQVCDESEAEEEDQDMDAHKFETKLLYNVEVEPKMMVPVQLIEGRLCKEVKINILSIAQEAQRLQTLQSHTFLRRRSEQSTRVNVSRVRILPQILCLFIFTHFFLWERLNSNANSSEINEKSPPELELGFQGENHPLTLPVVPLQERF